MDKLKLLQEAYAVAQRTGRSADASRVRAQIETIKRDAPTTITPEVDRSLELSNIERLLYQPDLTGADAAFRRLQDLEARDRDAGRDPKFAVLRAAALGQIDAVQGSEQESREAGRLL